MTEQREDEYARHVMNLARGMLPLENMRTGDAAIMLIAVARHEDSTTEHMVAGIFSNVEIAQEKLAGVIDNIYGGKPPDDND